MKTITTYDGIDYQIDCIGCAVSSRFISMDNSLVYEDKHFTVAQDIENPIPGFLVIGSRRHFMSMHEMNGEEQKSFSKVLFETGRVMKEELGIRAITLIQEDGTDGSHFHTWFFPWFSWMSDVGERLDSIRDIMKFSREHMKTKENLEEVHRCVRKSRDVFSVVV